MEDTPKCCLTCMFNHYECSQANRQACGRVKASQEAAYYNKPFNDLVSGGRQMGKTYAMDMSGAERRVMAWISDLNADDDAILLRAAEILRRRLGKKDMFKAMYGGRISPQSPAVKAFIYGEPPQYSYEELDEIFRKEYELKVPPEDETEHPNHDMANHFANHKKREWLKTDSGKAWLDKKGVTLREDSNPTQDWNVEDSEIKKRGI